MVHKDCKSGYHQCSPPLEDATNDISIPVITALIAACVALCGVAIQFLIAYLGRRQTGQQLALQELVSHRTTATLVADKRQKWIDELRTDMAFHLSLSQGIV